MNRHKCPQIILHYIPTYFTINQDNTSDIDQYYQKADIFLTYCFDWPSHKKDPSKQQLLVNKLKGDRVGLNHVLKLSAGVAAIWITPSLHSYYTAEMIILVKIDFSIFYNTKKRQVLNNIKYLAHDNFKTQHTPKTSFTNRFLITSQIKYMENKNIWKKLLCSILNKTKRRFVLGWRSVVLQVKYITISLFLSNLYQNWIVIGELLACFNQKGHV